ncbi:MAG: SseB family protein [Lachnospiraceae bacterium]|nr:SseB family protein [Lachnospiraceae bacterium]
MTKQEKIERLRNLPKAYILYSLFTRIPFIECEQSTFYDQAFLFETKEDAEAAAKKFFDGGDPVGITELKTVEMAPPQNADSNVVPMRKLMRNQVREHLAKFPTMGLNAVFFKPAEDEGESLPLDEVLPPEVKGALRNDHKELTGVQLTGIYFAQYLRRPQKDKDIAKERFEEFYANLARVKLLLPVIPEEGHKDDPQLDLKRCMLPIYTSKPQGAQPKEGEEAPKGTDENGMPTSALGVFTNMDELVVHSRNRIQDVRIVQIDLMESPRFLPENVEYIVIDPLTMSITLKVADVVRILKEIRGN